MEEIVSNNDIKKHCNLVFIEKIFQFTDYKLDIYKDVKEWILINNHSENVFAFGHEPSSDDVLLTVVLVMPHFCKGNLQNVINSKIFNFHERKHFKKLLLDICYGLQHLKNNGIY